MSENKENLVKTENPTGFKVIIREFKKDKLATFSFVFLMSLFVFIFIASMFIDDKEFTRVVIGKAFKFKKPDFTSFKYFLGTDVSGRSIMYQLIVGTRNSVLIGFSVTIITNLIGIFVGLITGYYGGKIDSIIMRIVDFIAILPTLLIIIVFVTMKPNNNIWHFVFIMSIFYWIGTARLVRSKALQEGKKDYVNASKTMGTSDLKIIFGSILPNISSIIIVNLTLAFAGNIGIETGLSFLGFGLSMNTPSIGILIANARDSVNLTQRLWLWLPASILILVMMLCINYIGQALRRASDAKQRLA